MTLMESDRQLFVFATNQLNLEAEELQRDLNLSIQSAMRLARELHPGCMIALQN
jgi:hypothetical protein